MNTTHSNSNPTMSATKAQPTRSRFHPATWTTGKKITALAAVATVLVGGWALFRPELIFVNQTVSETLATGAQGAPSLVSQGQFSSLAHHTEGNAQLYKADKGYLVRLAGFSTSNGPDVHVYVTRKAGTDSAAIKQGEFLDLGVIKGNIGDQNYALPTDFNAQQYQGLSIWCKRFGVNFAGANFDGAAAIQTVAQPATNETTSGDVVVTTGKFHKVGEGVTGSATIAENNKGERTLTLSDFQSAKGPNLHLYLVKAEDVKDSAGVKKAGFIDLGQLKALQGTQTYKVPKDIDLWQYLAVTVWCDKFKVNFATAPLASPQN